MTWFRNLKIGAKLLMGFSLVALVAAWIGWIGLTKVQQANATSQTMYKDRLIPIEDLGAAQAALLTMRGDVWRMFEEDRAVRQQLNANLDKQEAILQQRLAKYGQTELTEKEQELFIKLRAAYDRYRGERSKVVDALFHDEVKSAPGASARKRRRRRPQP